MTKEEIQDYTLKITQASKTGIIVILYELADKYLTDARDAFAAGNREEYRKNCMNAQKVIQDLIGALDFKYALAANLYRIYEYIGREISMSVIRNNPDKLLEVKKYLSDLEAAFEKVAKEDKSGPAMGNAQAVYTGLTYGRGRMMDSLTIESSNRGFKA